MTGQNLGGETVCDSIRVILDKHFNCNETY